MLEQYDSSGQLFARIANEQISFWKNGNQIGRFDRGHEDGSTDSYGVGITLEQPGRYIALGTHEPGSRIVDCKIWVDWSGVMIQGTRWADVRDAAFTGRNAMSHADNAMSHANNIQSRLVRLWDSVNSLLNAMNSYGFTTANGGTVGPGNFPSPIW